MKRSLYLPPRPNDMKNVDIITAAILRRAIIDWLVYHDTTSDRYKMYWRTADRYLRKGDYTMVLHVNPEWLMEVLEAKYKEGGYSINSLERQFIQVLGK